MTSHHWDYTNPSPTLPRMQPNHVRASQWATRKNSEILAFREALVTRGAVGDALNVDSLLIDLPVAVNMPVSFDEGRPLHMAAMRGHVCLTQVLVQRGAKLDMKNTRGKTSLHAACEANNAMVVYELLASGADADQKDTLGDTPMHKAAYCGSVDALVALLDYGADARCRDQGGLVAVHKAASMGRANALEILLQRMPYTVNAEANCGWTPLHLAAFGGFQQALQVLLHFGANVAATDTEGATPLHKAAFIGCEACCQALVRVGADVRATDTSKVTSLHVACEEGCTNVVRFLLVSGSSASAMDAMRRTALHVATAAGHAQICELLLAFGADPTFRDMSNGVSAPIDMARRCQQHHIVALFEAAAAEARAVEEAQTEAHASTPPAAHIVPLNPDAMESTESQHQHVRSASTP